MPKEHHDAKDGKGRCSLHENVFGRILSNRGNLLLHTLLYFHHGGVEDGDG